MKSQLVYVVGAALAIGTFQTFGNEPVPDHYIVKLKDDVAPTAVFGRYGLSPTHVYRLVFRGFAGRIPPGILKKLQQDPAVEAIWPDHFVYAFPKGGRKPPKNTSEGEQTPAGVMRIGAPQVWDQGITGQGIGVAVMDTGIDFNHPDLNDNFGGTVYDPYDGDGYDRHGHGTHVAGIIAAELNEQDVVGVAPQATLYSVRVLDASGTGTDTAVIDGCEALLEVAESLNIKVVNMSFGRPMSRSDLDPNSPLHLAIANLIDAGITVIAAAGNDCSVETSQMVPAGFEEVIAVASTTAVASKRIPADTASYFTTDGIEVVVSAPGEEREDVKGRVLRSVGILSTALGGGTTRMSGTSMAAPHVSGAVACLLQKAPSLTPYDVRGLLETTADRVGEVPLDSPTACYTFDGEREGIVYLPNLLSAISTN